MIRRSIKYSVILALLGTLTLGIHLGSFLFRPMHNTQTVEYEFQQGASVMRMARDLAQQKLIDYPFYLSLWSRITGQSTRLKAGEYSIPPGTTPFQLIAMMTEGKVKQYSLTIVEGWTFRQMMNAIRENPYIRHTLDDSDASIMKAIGHPGEHPEGRFYPDTYQFPKTMTDVAFLKRAYEDMSRRLERAWQQRDVGLPLKDAYDALILASIVEKESARADERRKIAGVFINRLQKGMRLQTDPTVIYGMGASYDGDIRFRDLKKDTPYNTYTRSGLPPTPIALPGQGSLDAVVHPEQTSALYFVAIGDDSGRHVFSDTLAEHEKAVDKYQRKRK